MFVLGAPRIASEEIFAAALGIAAAALLVGSSFLLRWQRNRQRFELTRLALENGATQFPKGPPFWLVSLREALSTLALGLGLLAVGAISYGMGSRVPAPTQAQILATQPQRPPENEEPPGRRPPPPARPTRGPEEDGPPRPEDRRPLPPVPNPVLEQWHRGQAMQNVGLIAMGCGGVLTLLGIVRAGFARVEREYAGDDSSQA